MMRVLLTAFVLHLLLSSHHAARAQDAAEIVARADRHLRGESSVAELTVIVQRPDYSRELRLKAWSLGTEYSLILITYPARDKGTTFLKRGNEIWNWIPAIERVIKIPPSMMMQSWMGSDFNNDDLVRESSIVEDYGHAVLGDSTIAGRECWQLELRPRPEAPVVWDRILLWVGKQHYLQLRAEYYDEDGELVNVMQASEVKELGGRLLPAVWEMIPQDDPRKRTILRYEAVEFDLPMDEGIFTQRYMKRVH